MLINGACIVYDQALFLCLMGTGYELQGTGCQVLIARKEAQERS